MRHQFTKLIGLLLAVLMPMQALAQRSDLDLRVVVDLSESMAQADPENLRAQAMEYLIRVIPDDARAGIWSYAQYVRKVANYEPASPLWKQVASIRVASLASDGKGAKLVAALHAAGWDKSTARHKRDIVLLSNGAIRGVDDPAAARQTLLREWATDLRKQGIRVHTLAVGDLAAGDLDLLRQLAQVSNGFFRRVEDAADLKSALVDLEKVLLSAPQVRPDSAGRFQVAPGAERMTVTWLDPQALDETPILRQPDGVSLTRLTGIPSGRWLVADKFEMLTLTNPQPGWWQISGPPPDRMAIYGELDIRVEGIDATVVPTDDSKVLIKLFSQDQQIKQQDFLDLLHLNVWVHTADGKRPLPVDASADGFVAHFVNLEDGAHELQVEVIAPTFTRSVEVPFTVANPLVVDIVTAADGNAMAWLQFSHPLVDYASVRATGIVRKPPQIASLIPAERMPAGMWGIPIGFSEGIVEVAFSVAGNYLSGAGIFLKTKPHALNLPLPEGEHLRLRYDADGKLLHEVAPHIESADPQLPQGGAMTIGAANAANSENPGVTDATSFIQTSAPEEPSLPLLPLWFVALISVCNLAIAGLLWWLNKPKPLPFTPA